MRFATKSVEEHLCLNCCCSLCIDCHLGPSVSLLRVHWCATPVQTVRYHAGGPQRCKASQSWGATARTDSLGLVQWGVHGPRRFERIDGFSRLFARAEPLPIATSPVASSPGPTAESSFSFPLSIGTRPRSRGGFRVVRHTLGDPATAARAAEGQRSVIIFTSLTFSSISQPVYASGMVSVPSEGQSVEVEDEDAETQRGETRSQRASQRGKQCLCSRGGVNARGGAAAPFFHPIAATTTATAPKKAGKETPSREASGGGVRTAAGQKNGEQTPPPVGGVLTASVLKNSLSTRARRQPS